MVENGQRPHSSRAESSVHFFFGRGREKKVKRKKGKTEKREIQLSEVNCITHHHGQLKLSESSKSRAAP